MAVGIKGFTILLAILMSGSTRAAFAQDAPKPEDSAPAAAVEHVIVTAPRQRPEEALDSFIINHAAATPGIAGKVGRWKLGICPVTLGLPPKFDQFVTQRIVRLAMSVGAPLDSDEPCRPNVTVLATDHPQELLDLIRTRHGALLGYHRLSQARDIATMRLPIQAWYSTATEDFWGIIQADEPGLYLKKVLPKDPGAPVMVHVSGFHNEDGLKTRFTTALVIVDTRKIVGRQIGPLADYIAMLALSKGQSYEACQAIPSITNLMAPGCGAEMQPDALTDIDVAYLRGLYKASAGNSYLGERGAIAYEMKKTLGGY